MAGPIQDAERDRLGTTVRDKWVLEELLGVGGMASVYAARHKIGRRDAIKILHRKIAESDQLRARFEQEAHAVNAFRHPGVVEIRDVDTTEDGAPFLVMELLEGESLAKRLERVRTLDPREALNIAAQVLDVLAAAHQRGIIHRDIKPDNVFLANDGKVKVLDFGIARVRAADKRALTTKAGVTLGTMAYMAPEQARGEEIDVRADVYAVGATLFRVLAGRIVHDADSEAGLVMRVIAYGAPRLATVMPGIDPNVAAVVDRSLAFDLVDRYPDAATMLADVRALLESKIPPYASTARPIPERKFDSLFDATSSASKGKPTVVPPARMQAPVTQPGRGPLGEPGGGAPAMPATVRANLDPSASTRVSGADVPSNAYASVPTRISQEDAPAAAAVPSAPLSDRVVIVPSVRGEAVSVQNASAGSSAGSGSAIATVFGHPPPVMPMPPAPVPMPPRPEPVLTPFGELSAFVRQGPSVMMLALAGGIVALAVLLLVITLVWATSGTTTHTTEAAEPSPVPEVTTPAARPIELPPPPVPSPGPPGKRKR